MSKIPTRVLWQRTLLIYRSGWKEHFLTALPPAIISVLIYLAGNLLLVELYRVGRPFYVNHVLLITSKALAVRLTEFALPWILTTLAYAAVSANILLKSPTSERAISDYYSPARERLGSLFRVGLITFPAMVAGYAISLAFSFVIGFSSFVPKQHRLMTLDLVLAASVILWAGLLSRAALSVPILMTSDNRTQGAWDAIKKSIKMSEGYEPFFIFLVAQTLLLSFLGPWVGRQVLLQLWLRDSVSANAYSWIGYSLDALLPAAIETFAFAGFTVVYMELRGASRVVQDAESTEGIGSIPISPR
jgi:hypothetical protein